MRKERKLSFCLADNVLADRFRSRNKFGMTSKAVLVLLAAPFMLGEMGEASAQCTTKQECVALGYNSSSNTGNCIMCPFGDTWFCPPKNNSCNSDFCSGYTLTKTQAQSQCGYANYEGCEDPCTKNVFYKCDYGSSSGGSSGGICQNEEEIKADYTIDCYCNTIGGQYQLIQRKNFSCQSDGSWPPDWQTTTSLDRFRSMSECESALSQNTENCSGTFETSSSKCGTRCLD